MTDQTPPNPANDLSGDLDGFDMTMYEIGCIKDGMTILMHGLKVVYAGELEGAADPELVFDTAFVSPKDGNRFKAYCAATGQDGWRQPS